MYPIIRIFFFTLKPPTLSSIFLAVSFFSVMATKLYFSVDTCGKVFELATSGSSVTSCVELRGHNKEVYKILSLGARILPRHWLPSIIGRSNIIEHYR